MRKILKNHDYVKELIENTTPRTGLKVKAHIIKKSYQTGRKHSDNFKETMRIIIWGNGIIERYREKHNYVQFILYLLR